MTKINQFKPRYKLSHLTKTKIWPYKDGYLRGFYRIRSKKIKPKGIFKKTVRVAKNRKWTEARNFFRPDSISIGKKLIFGKSAFGRPKAVARRYNNLFYIKQKLYKFHGKIKEKSFKIIFKTHIIQMSTKTDSFYSVLESRMNIVFFRIRLLPTIFACHQFIQYNGLEVNNKLEISPNSQIKVGDMITVPEQAWINFYWNVYYRLYYRRWGLYVFKRRLIKKIKKQLFFNFNRKNTKFNIKHIFTSNQIAKKNENYVNKLNNLQDYCSIQTVFDDFPPIKTGLRQETINNRKLAINVFAKILINVKSLTDSKAKDKAMLKLIAKKEEVAIMFDKITQYQKIYFNSYFFSIQLKKKKWKGYYWKSHSFKKDQKRQLIWLFWKIVKHQKRKKIIIRLKPVHFFIPTYLMIDFRTLSAIKIKSPSYKDRHYPFQISLAKTTSFFKSQGF